MTFKQTKKRIQQILSNKVPENIINYIALRSLNNSLKKIRIQKVKSLTSKTDELTFIILNRGFKILGDDFLYFKIGRFKNNELWETMAKHVIHEKDIDSIKNDIKNIYSFLIENDTVERISEIILSKEKNLSIDLEL